MDELTLMRSFRAEHVKPSPTARAAARQALEARFESAPAVSAQSATPLRRRRLGLGRRRLLAFATATATAAVVAAVLVSSSGPTAHSAAAEILRETAAVAAAGDAPTEIPGPGQFYYRKFKRLELQSWIPGGELMGGGLMTRPGAFEALMPTTQEWWTAADGAGRVREVAGTPRFLTKEERRRWEATGSRLPSPFDPEYQRKYPLAFDHALELRRGLVDREVPRLEGFRFPDTSKLPTDPEELRRTIEGNRIPISGFNPMHPGANRLDAGRTIAQLLNILVEGRPMTPQLRAAVFNALAEMPGIEVDTDAADSLGRPGYAIRSIDRRTGGGTEYIFDPDTAEMLAERAFLGDRDRSAFLKGLPSGLTIRETAYLETGVVDSTRETAREAEAGEPVATASP
ncbi:MAG TPA: CU044_5270 family protein [Solirubrobacterales bacterium]|nr:CU044_5270 family protein [Solirubrobacterales bacterium]